MSQKRNKTSGTKQCICDRCGLTHPSTVEGTKHRRCGGSPGEDIRPKHSAKGPQGVWR